MSLLKKSGIKPIAKGKTKEIWAVEGDDTLVIMQNTDATTADNDASKTKYMIGKGKCATITTSRMFELLEQAGIPTAYVQQISDKEILAKKCSMIPLESVIRRYADGSYLDRMPQLKRKGIPYRFHPLKYELFLKTNSGRLNTLGGMGGLDVRNYIPKDKEQLIKYLNVSKTLKEIQKGMPDIKNLMELDYEILVEEVVKIIDDPWIESPNCIDQWVLRHPKKPTWEIEPLKTIDPAKFMDSRMLGFLILDGGISKIEQITRKVFLVLEGAWNTLGFRLIDFKIEFGLDKDGNLLVSDVIDNDSWRIRTADGEELSKQNFRDGHPLAEVMENYERVAQLANQLRIPKQAIVVWRGSEKDSFECFDNFSAEAFTNKEFIKNIPVGANVEYVTISGHKSPLQAIDKLDELHSKYPEGAVIIAMVGMSNGLGPILSARTNWPVLSYCASAKSNPEDVWSNLRMPSSVPNATFLNIQNAYFAALNILSQKNPAAYMVRQYEIEKFGMK